MRVSRLFITTFAMAMALYSGAVFAQAEARVNALADQYVAAFRESFPFDYDSSGLPNPIRDRFNINAPGDLAKWRALTDRLDQEAAAIDANALRGRPEAITLAILRQAVTRTRARRLCHLELWYVASDDWLLAFLQIAEIQPVSNDAERKTALVRFGRVPAFVEEEMRNLRSGLKGGYSASRTAVDEMLAELDRLLSEPIAATGFMNPATCADSPAFTRQWNALLTTKVMPALTRYRDFLRSEYRQRARTNPSINANPDGAACYRATLAAATTVEIDPQSMYESGVKRVEKEVQGALEAGRRHYGRAFQSLTELQSALAMDPTNRFASEQELTQFIQATLVRSKASSARVVSNVPREDVTLKPFPTANAPSGQYIPGDAEGTREAIYYYRADFQNLSPAALEATVLHEVWPGHHLQFLVSKANTSSHPIVQLVFFPGVGEGWATYVESLAREQALYGSDLAIMGSVMDSLSPRLVADLGIHTRGWSEEQCLQYLIASIPALPPERLKSTLGAIVSTPGAMVPYAAGALQIEALRDRAQRTLGPRFDLRRFHDLVIEDGTVPFPVLAQKLDEWARRR